MAQYLSGGAASRTPLLGPAFKSVQPFTRTISKPNPYGGLIGQVSTQQASAKKANLQRYSQMMDIWNKVIARSEPGGAFEKAGLGEIEKAKTKGVGKETQSLISGGMYGTTTTAGVGRKWEADVGAPARLRLEDIMEQRLSTAQIGKAGAIERREDVYPDYNALLQMLAR